MSTIDEFLLTDIAHKSDFLVSSTGDTQTISGVANLKEALFRRLITSPGTLMHRPDYGIGIEDFQNSLSDIDNRRALALRIQEQFALDPRVESVEAIDITADDERPDQVVVSVKIKVAGYGDLSASFAPFGGNS